MSGNHDTPEHLQMMRALLSLEGEAQSRLHVIEQPEFFEMCGVQWGAMPYPDRDTLARYARENQAAGEGDRDGAMSSGYAREVARIASHFDGSKPAVFIGHVTVAGRQNAFGDGAVLRARTSHRNGRFAQKRRLHRARPYSSAAAHQGRGRGAVLLLRRFGQI